MVKYRLEFYYTLSMATRPTSKNPRRRKNHLVTDQAQRAALASPARVEVIEHLCVIGPASVRELADRIGVSPHALHYHVRRLRDVGLLVAAGSRKSGPRDEALYDIVADRIEIAVDAGAGAAAEARTVRTILRRAERDFTAVATTAPERLEADEGRASRARARLSKGARKQVIRHLEAIDGIFADQIRRDHPPQAHTEPFTLTVVFVPEV